MLRSENNIVKFFYVNVNPFAVSQVFTLQSSQFTTVSRNLMF